MTILKELNDLIEPSKGVEFSVPLIDRKNGVLGNIILDVPSY